MAPLILTPTMEGLDTPEAAIALAAAAVALIALIVATVALLRLRRLRSAQKAVLGDQGNEDLVAHAVDTSERVDDLQRGIDDVSRALFAKIEEIDAALAGSVAHTAVVRYDAFNESSGKQSSSIAVLDRHGDGFIVSAILQREQARVYAKPVRDGKSGLALSPEEEQAVTEALASQPRRPADGAG